MKECCKGNPRSANNKDKRGKEKILQMLAG
jgi:hypothetical protein